MFMNVQHEAVALSPVNDVDQVSNFQGASSASSSLLKDVDTKRVLLSMSEETEIPRSSKPLQKKQGDEQRATPSSELFEIAFICLELLALHR